MTRRVKFDEEAKPHDGLSAESRVVLNAIRLFFSGKMGEGDAGIQQLSEVVGGDRRLAVRACFAVSRIDACFRNAQQEEPSNNLKVAVLPQGGSTMKLTTAHAPYMRTLCRMLRETASKLDT